MGWMKFLWTNDINQDVKGLAATIDTIILGINLALGSIPYWANIASDPENAEYEAGIIFTQTPK